MRVLQRFDDDYLERCRGMTPDEVIAFLEDFRRLHAEKSAPSKLISLKVPVDLLRAFRVKAELERVPYQTRIKSLMKAWVTGDDLS